MPVATLQEVRSTIEPLEGNKVKVVVEVEEAEFDKELDAAFRRLAKDVRLPGFRPGKAPRKVLEARIGQGYAREEAFRHSLPDYYSKAVIEHQVDVIAPPEIDITDGMDSGGVTFDAVVEVRPSIEVGPGYEAASKLLDRRPDITAITAANDLIALGCYRVARERGLVVGEDLCIVGYNDIPLLDLLEPPLTSVRVPYREMGAEAARALLEVMADRTKMDRPFSIHLPPTLSVRGSTGARPA